MSKNSATSRASGAPPEMEKRRRPPRRSRTFENTRERAHGELPARERRGALAAPLRAAHLAPDPHRPLEQAALGAALLLHLRDDLDVGALVQARHRDHDRRADLGELRRHALDRLHVVDLGAAVEEDVVHRALEHVRKRQERHADVALGDRVELADGLHLRDEVAVGEHDALRLAGRARGVDQAREVGARERRRLGPAPVRRQGQLAERLEPVGEAAVHPEQRAPRAGPKRPPGRCGRAPSPRPRAAWRASRRRCSGPGSRASVE